MKIIEAMKTIKSLQIKASDLQKKVSLYHADLSYETPAYGARQRDQIYEWIQSHSDTVKEILRLRLAIQRTNLKTKVTILLDEKQVEKSIAEWIHRRRDLAEMERNIWSSLNDKGLKEGQTRQTSGDVVDVKIRRYYEPTERDHKVAVYREEPSIIDGTLEVVNAVTDLIEAE